MGYPVTEYNPNSTERRDNGGPNALGNTKHRPRLFDTTLTALAIATFIAALHLVITERLDWITLASASSMGLLVGLVALFFVRRSGVFLTAGLRVLLIVMLTASTSMITYGWFTVDRRAGGSPSTDEAFVNNAAQARVALARANQALEDKDQLLAYKNQLIKNQNDRFNKLLADMQTASEGDKKELLQKEADQRLAEQLDQHIRDKESQKKPTSPNVNHGSAPKKDNDILAEAFDIPPEEVEETRIVLERTPLGRFHLDHLLGNFPLVGPILGLLLGSDVRVTVTRVIKQLQEGKQIPNEDDLYKLFNAARDPSQRLKLKKELMEIVSDAQRRKVIDGKTAENIENKFDEIIKQLDTPLRPEVKQAIDRVSDDIKKGQPCNTNIPEIFSSFASISEKQRALITISNQSVRNCMAKFSPDPR